MVADKAVARGEGLLRRAVPVLGEAWLGRGTIVSGEEKGDEEKEKNLMMTCGSV